MLLRPTSLRAAAAGAAATAVLVVVAGCGGGSDDPAVRTTTPSASPSASATTPTGGTSSGSRPKDERTDAGAIAFSAFVTQTVVATTGGAPLDDLLKTATDSCDGCIELAKDIGQDPTEVQRFDQAPAVSGAKVIKKDGSDYVVEQSVAVPAGQRVRTADSSVVSEIAPATYRWVIRSTWKDDRWLVADYSVEKTS